MRTNLPDNSSALDRHINRSRSHARQERGCVVVTLAKSVGVLQQIAHALGERGYNGIDMLVLTSESREECI